MADPQHLTISQEVNQQIQAEEVLHLVSEDTPCALSLTGKSFPGSSGIPVKSLFVVAYPCGRPDWAGTRHCPPLPYKITTIVGDPISVIRRIS